MKNKKLISIILPTLFGGISVAQAHDACMDIGTTNAQIAFGDCSEVWKTLKKSHKFPHIFSSSTPKLYPGLCFVSAPGGIPAKLGSIDINVTSASAWTTEFSPYLPPLLNGPDNIASIISKWTVTETHSNRLLGNIYTVDALDTGNLNPATPGAYTSSSVRLSELDVVIGGDRFFRGASGTVRIDSSLDLVSNSVNLTEIKGKICFDD